MTFLDHDVASNTSGNDEPLGSDAGRASSTGVRGDWGGAASRVGSAGASSAGGNAGHLGALGLAVVVDNVGGGGDRQGDCERREVGVLGDRDGRGVLDNSRGAAESSDGGLLDGLGRRDVGGRDGLGGGRVEGGGHSRGTSPGGGAGHVAVVVDAALGTYGGVNAGHLGGDSSIAHGAEACEAVALFSNIGLCLFAGSYSSFDKTRGRR